ncbi:Helicase-like [Rhodopseudomonas palustris HaA2]|uniref:Helicase-like n=1 Tax=Rhodopseudomonas palustris (strain HaA2) TaxID=316058 RepID=Q2IX23_RHOP2|nr:DEAD/DEAH box helicase family protein [Rhodopseudomonas palustris]ABD07237.1 Helicase-like [Rhodopseudomonas palustris HaA2]
MADPLALAGLSADDRQELKEAVCDAVLDRTRQIVSGEGDFGRTIFHERPARRLSSGFILPRLDAAGDDESSDIRIASHGLDFRLLSGGSGEIIVQPTFSVYVRALPTTDELFARNGWLIPPPGFNQAAKIQIRDARRQRFNSEIPAGATPGEKSRLRAKISREVYTAFGVVVPANTPSPPIGIDAETNETPAANGDQLAENGDPIGLLPVPGLDRLRIPNALSQRYEVPLKWIRLAVEVEPLRLPLPCEPDAWTRVTSAYKLILNGAIKAAYRSWIGSPDGELNAWRKVYPPSESFWSRENWDRFLLDARGRPRIEKDLVPDFDIEILAQALQDPLVPGAYSTRIAIENMREGDPTQEFGLFGVSLNVTIPPDVIGPMRLERVKRSYHLAGFMTMPAMGVNGGVEDLGISVGGRQMRTTWMPRYVLPRTTATEVPAVVTQYGSLCLTTTDVSVLQALPGEMDQWIEKVAENTAISQPGEEGSDIDESAQRTRFGDDLQAWKREADRIRKGAQILSRSRQAWQIAPNSSAAIPYRAWILLNRTMARANPDTPGNRPRWRLFQLAFILAHVPTFASRVPEFASDFDAAFDEDAASLLYMATGGGKTEAFFGILVFALFLDRIRGKLRGVTAMMHYPLRLLTVQQAQRLARLLANAEMVRRSERIGGAAFEIGFWVGSANTPNVTEERQGKPSEQMRCIPIVDSPRGRDEQAVLAGQSRADREYVIAHEAWNKLPRCPFCNSPRETGLRLYPEQDHRLGIVCFEARCDWNLATSGRDGHRAPLPFLLTDTDIYRAAPSVLLGTIDKLALLGQNVATIDRIAGMLGMARYIQGGPLGRLHMAPQQNADVPADFRRVAPSFASGDEVFFDPFPSLIVQDEMHLLEESLGTFGGIFETALFEWMSRLAPLLGDRVAQVHAAPGKPRLPHVIGATATAADVAKHTKAVYQRQVVQFPHPGPALHEGFYTQLATFEPTGDAAQTRLASGTTPRGLELAAPWGRVYASLMTNGRLHTVTTLSVLAAHAATITRWQRDLSSSDPTRQARAADEMMASVSSAPWADRRSRALREAAAAGRYDRLAQLVDLHRIQLTYVTNKKGGDQILSALETEVREIHAAMGEEYTLSDFSMELISGGVDIADIQSVIRRSEQPFDPMSEDIATTLRGIVATSAISHGVDVEFFNAMAFAGMPSDVAEYIQASSRVGRTHVGFSLLIPTPQTRRDRFIVEVHEAFHRLLERMISPPAVERWADRAIGRTIPSMVQTWLSGVRYNERFVATADDQKATVNMPSTVEAAARLLRNRPDFDDCVRFVANAVGIGAATGAPTNPDYYGDLVRSQIDRIRQVLDSKSYTGSLNDFWKATNTGLVRPMTSLRDVDVQGRIQGSRLSQKNRPITDEQLLGAVTMIRNRCVSRRRRYGATSELDDGADGATT